MNIFTFTLAAIGNSDQYVTSCTCALIGMSCQYMPATYSKIARHESELEETRLVHSITQELTITLSTAKDFALSTSKVWTQVCNTSHRFAGMIIVLSLGTLSS